MSPILKNHIDIITHSMMFIYWSFLVVFPPIIEIRQTHLNIALTFAVSILILIMMARSMDCVQIEVNGAWMARAFV